ncbi:hypothetical protein DV711_06265 [Motiliproteus coralliicola]|uniref:Uncharacterized protein n=1 Tax=Motiliproteus coralliicola TaxID=2283196 RepID=A0A369WU17_9GAMM|nr:hypothetical protein [Motiliproteus coralliicola]RDE25157.1 hypothetical protein DV711_06265 [Motiliproteus coralliicola]
MARTYDETELKAIKQRYHFDRELGLVKTKTGEQARCYSTSRQIQIAAQARYISFSPARVCWFLATGQWPTGRVRTANGNHNDTRPINLYCGSVCLYNLLAQKDSTPEQPQATANIHPLPSAQHADIKVIRRQVEHLSDQLSEQQEATSETLTKLRREVFQVSEALNTLLKEFGVKAS